MGQSVFCITILAPSYPDPNNCCSTHWNTVLPPARNEGCRVLFSQSGQRTKPTVCTQSLWCAPGNACVIAVCSFKYNYPGSAANSELSVYFVLSSPWIKLKNNPEFVINHSTTAVKLLDFLYNQHTNIHVLLWLHGIPD